MIDNFLVDLDGVLADMAAYIKTESGIDLDSFASGNKQHRWMDGFMDEHIPKGMFTKFPPTKGFGSLYNAIQKLQRKGYEVVVLTSISDRPMNHMVAQQKSQWLSDHGLGSLPVLTTEHSKDKANFANMNSVLIDDPMKSIAPFRDAGGYGILYDDSIDVEFELRQLGVEI